MDHGRLTGRGAIITGGGRGIGKATAFKMVREGASVALLDIFSDEAARVAQDWEAAGGKALGVKADVSRKDEVDRAVERALRHFRRVDILVNNAGVVRPGALEKVREED
jgi:NAD(P)-dependent dehydrogenase (short-subunit alcohol dehydrogenase family)